MSLWAELRSRNVVKVGVTYGAVAWLLIQATDIMLPQFSAPAWVAPTITFILILTFPVVLLIAWAFEITPEGIRKAVPAITEEYMDERIADRKRDPTARERPAPKSAVMGFSIAATIAFVTILSLWFAESFRNTENVNAVSTRSNAETTRGTVRFSTRISPPIRRRELLGAGPRSIVAISQNASRIAVSAGPLMLRRLNSLDFESVGTDQGALQPFFSPDGEWLAYFLPTIGLRKVRIGGGDPLTVAADIPNSLWGFGVWKDDDTIVYSNETTALWAVSAEGGTPQAIAASIAPARFVIGPVATAANGDLLFTSINGLTLDAVPQIELFDADEDQAFKILDDAMLAGLTSSNHLLFVRGREVLMAAAFDPESRRLGPAVPVPESVALDGVGGAPQLAVSRSGTLVYLGEVATEQPRVQAAVGWVSRDGVFEALMELPASYGRLSLDLAPDDRSILLSGSLSPGATDYVTHRVDIDRGGLTRLSVVTQSASWDPQGERIVLGGARGLRSWDVETGTETELGLGIDDARGVSFAGNGRTVVYTAMRPDPNIYAFDIETGTERAVLESGAFEIWPAVSPDGNWIAYVSNESSDRNDVRVARFADGVHQLQLTTEGGAVPVWSRDGMELFFLANKPSQVHWELQVVSVLPSSTPQRLRLSEARSLFVFWGEDQDKNHFAFNGDGASYDVAADSQRFAVRRVPPPAQPEPADLVVVQNWLDELNSLAPPLE